MSPRIHVIGDTHLGHKLIAEFRGFSSVEEHDEAVVDNWNSVVNPKDTVWHLGDVAMPKAALKIIGRCNGLKRLVLGNHDQNSISEYAKYFSKVYGVVKFKGMVFSHVPIHPNEFEYRWGFNVHGHIHHEERLIDDPRYFCVNADIIGLKPMLLDEVIAIKEEVINDN